MDFPTRLAQQTIADRANEALKGKTVVAVRPCTKDELDGTGWSSPFTVIEFNDGTWLNAQCDGEGNDAGVLYILPPTGNSILA